MKSEALWLSVSPHLARFDQRLLLRLSKTYQVEWWAYDQSPDAPCCLDAAIVLLHDFLKAKARPLHLIGHGLSGVVAWIYASQYPERVKSLTLLSVFITNIRNWLRSGFKMNGTLSARSLPEHIAIAKPLSNASP